MHDIAEERLYWIHMVQHSLLTVVVPPLMLLAIPTWLARLIVGDGRFKRFVYFWARPVPALIVFNFLIALVALGVDRQRRRSPTGGSTTGSTPCSCSPSLLVWMPVCGPIPELVGVAAAEDADRLPDVDHPDHPRRVPHHGGDVDLLRVRPWPPAVGVRRGLRPAGRRCRHEGDHRLLPLGDHRRDLLPVGARRPDEHAEVPRQARSPSRRPNAELVDTEPQPTRSGRRNGRH